MALNFANDNIWVDKKRYDAAECQYYESLTKELVKQKLNNEVKSEITCNGDVSDLINEVKTENIAEIIIRNAIEKPKNTPNTKNKLAAAFNKPASQQSAKEDVPPVKSNSKKNKKKKNKAQEIIKNDNSCVKANLTGALINEKSLNAESPNPKGKKHQNASAHKRGTSSNNHCTLVSEIAKAREHIKNSLEKMDGITTFGPASNSSELVDRLVAVEKENSDLKKLIENLKNLVLDSQKRIAALEAKSGGVQQPQVNNVPKPQAAAAEDDDGVDLFASDDEEEDAEAARVREERLAAYAAKKAKKPVLIAKSSLVLDVKPWDDETDLSAMEAEIRKITSDGLLWGASKFVPVAFGIKKLSISCVVEDEKVSIDWLTEEIEKFEDFVQSVDVAAFNKI